MYADNIYATYNLLYQCNNIYNTLAVTMEMLLHKHIPMVESIIITLLSLSNHMKLHKHNAGDKGNLLTSNNQATQSSNPTSLDDIIDQEYYCTQEYHYGYLVIAISI